MAIDPDWASVVLYLDFEGANNDTTTTDESMSAHAITFHSGAKLSTAQKPYGNTSLLLNGTSDWISAADSADWSFGSGLFTVEGHLYSTSVSGTRFLIGQWNNTGDLSWVVFQNGNQLALNVSTTGSDNIAQLSGGTIPTNTWQHFAVCFDGTKYRAFLAGVMVASSTTLRTLFNSPDVLAIGSNSSGGSFFTAGNLKGIRISKGVCRYPSDTSFTPPTTAFPKEGPADIRVAQGVILALTKVVAPTQIAQGALLLLRRKPGRRILTLTNTGYD